MTLRVGVLPHADLPHLIPCFRICRELLKWGHDVRVLGSDVCTIGRGHGEAWRDSLAGYGLGGRELTHRSRDVAFPDWLVRQSKELGLDVIVLDAVWQGLAFACHASAAVRRVVVHHAGLPDFRSRDMPTWRFVHPGHPKDHWARARASIEQLERTGRWVRAQLSSIKALSPAGRAAADSFEFGCGEFATLPAVRAISLCPAAEFPGERGRLEYFGTLLPKPGDVDWRPPPPELTDGSAPLVACVFGTTGLHSTEQFEWLAALAENLARSLPDCQVLAVIPDWAKARGPADGDGGRLKNLLCYPWVPLWEVLSTRRAASVLVAPPGVGAFREAVASGTPVVAIPRRLDQFGAAARVEYFGVGAALVSTELPPPDLVVQRVAHVLHDRDIHSRTQRLRREFVAFDETMPLKRFIEGPA